MGNNVFSDRPRDEFGQMLEGCRQYLTLIAADQLGDALKRKVGVSDLVQETFLAAHESFDQFQGKTHEELLSWLRAILLHRITNLNRHHRAAKRSIDRELAANLSANLLDQLFRSSNTTPSGKAIRAEESRRLTKAMATLDSEYQTVLRLRHYDGLRFADIGTRMSRSSAAARMLWYRAIKQLTLKLLEAK